MIAGQVHTPHGPVATVTDGTGDRTVVLLHGLGGDHRQALGFAPPASDLPGGPGRWRKVAVDLRGHGDTATLGPPETLTYQAFTEDLAAVLRHLADARGRPPLTVIGMSMGAELALQAALRYPELIRSLVIIRPSGPSAPAGPAAGVYPVLADCLRRLGPDDGKAAFAHSPAYQAVARRNLASAASLRRQFDRPGARVRVDVLDGIAGSRRLCADELGRIGVPALVCVSPSDPSHEMRCGRVIAQRLPHARPLVILPQKMTAPGAHEESLRRAVGDFLAGQAAEAGQ